MSLAYPPHFLPRRAGCSGRNRISTYVSPPHARTRQSLRTATGWRPPLRQVAGQRRTYSYLCLAQSKRLSNLGRDRLLARGTQRAAPPAKIGSINLENRNDPDARKMIQTVRAIQHHVESAGLISSPYRCDDKDIDPRDIKVRSDVIGRKNDRWMRADRMGKREIKNVPLPHAFALARLRRSSARTFIFAMTRLKRLISATSSAVKPPWAKTALRGFAAFLAILTLGRMLITHLRYYLSTASQSYLPRFPAQLI